MDNMIKSQSSPSAKIPSSQQGTGIREVWAYNFEEQMLELMDLLENTKYVAMDTEFPGIVYPKSKDQKKMGYLNFNQYSVVQTNCNKLKLIQVGFALSDDQGKLVKDDAVWQFNIQFDLSTEEYDKDSINMLKRCGIAFNKFKKQGIDINDFAEYLMGSGLICNEDITWIVFHGSFDFGYLLKILTGEQLPQKSDVFFKTLKLYCPKIYDIKFLIQNVDDLNGGLNRIANFVGVIRKGQQHQAGSDSLLTLNLFQKLKNGKYGDKIDLTTKFMVFGLDSDKEYQPEQEQFFQGGMSDNYIFNDQLDDFNIPYDIGFNMSNGINYPQPGSFWNERNNTSQSGFFVNGRKYSGMGGLDRPLYDNNIFSTNNRPPSQPPIQFYNNPNVFFNFDQP